MENTSNRMSADQFFERLRENKLDFAQSTVIQGMVKKANSAERVIEFAPGNCEHWISVPLEQIDNVEFISQMRCKDHSHPYVTLFLKPADSVEGKLFQALLRSLLPPSPQPPTAALTYSSAPTVGRYPAGVPAPSRTPYMARPLTRTICKKVCGPAVCPNPTGPGTVWCTDCWIECGPDPTDLPLTPGYYEAW